VIKRLDGNIHVLVVDLDDQGAQSFEFTGNERNLIYNVNQQVKGREDKNG
jgi:hypothetical protein